MIVSKQNICQVQRRDSLVFFECAQCIVYYIYCCFHCILFLSFVAIAKEDHCERCCFSLLFLFMGLVIFWYGIRLLLLLFK